ncbi:MAG: endonuclease III [Nanoarchaeota archaeon]|nr:endonuclease III [Nanoarchaeota archaeon]
MDNTNVDTVIRILKRETKFLVTPIVTQYSWHRNPFRVLVSTLLSLRTKDATTAAASKRLFAVARTPHAIVKLPISKLEKLIYPVGFYKAKAKRLHEVCSILLDEYSGNIPNTIDELLKFPGVGRKTANLVVTLGYNKLGICVDTHVHRISNRLGYVKTKTPEQTEFALRKKLPKKHWIVYNDVLVTWGQNICHPTSPWCSRCAIRPYCKRINVLRSR